MLNLKSSPIKRPIIHVRRGELIEKTELRSKIPNEENISCSSQEPLRSAPSDTAGPQTDVVRRKSQSRLPSAVLRPAASHTSYSRSQIRLRRYSEQPLADPCSHTREPPST
ncbi:hypothetical protein RYX36_005653 [Vicia faba]